MKTTVFTGKYMPGAIKRQLTSVDDATGKAVTSRLVMDRVEGLVLAKVSGHGEFSNTGERYVTLTGQYGPGEQLRITASAQNYDLLSKALLADNVDRSAGKTPNGQISWPLNVEHVVNVHGRKMAGFGFMVEELYLVKDGKTTPIIGAPEQPKATAAEDFAF